MWHVHDKLHFLPSENKPAAKRTYRYKKRKKRQRGDEESSITIIIIVILSYFLLLIFMNAENPFYCDRARFVKRRMIHQNNDYLVSLVRYIPIWTTGCSNTTLIAKVTVLWIAEAHAKIFILPDPLS